MLATYKICTISWTPAQFSCTLILTMRTLRKKLMDEWVRANKPDGIRKLAEATQIPSGSLQKIRQGRDIQIELYRESLSRVLGVSVAELFPSAKGKSRAS